MTDVNLLLADVRALVECESPSSDLAAVARSAEVVARIGTARLGVEPERIVLDGRPFPFPTIFVGTGPGHPAAVLARCQA